MASKVESLEQRRLLTVDSFVKLASGLNGTPALADFDNFGIAITSLGDMNGDGTEDLAVGARNSITGNGTRGSVHILFMNDDGTVASSTRISDGLNGGPTLADHDEFGSSVAAIGDLDGDGVTDLAIGALGDGAGLLGHGAVYIAFLNADGTVKSSTKIGDQLNGGPNLGENDLFGLSAAFLGDLDGDTRPELAVGAFNDSSGTAGGVVYVLSLNDDGTAESVTEISNGLNGGPTLGSSDRFGNAITNLGDLDGDGITDMAVGAVDPIPPGFNSFGAVYIVYMNANGTAKSTTKITNVLNGGPNLNLNDFFGGSLAAFGDLDNDGIEDLVVGAPGTDAGGPERGLAYILFLNTDGSVKGFTRIGNNIGGGPTLADGDFFGKTVAPIGDLNDDGKIDLAIAATSDDTGGPFRGAVHVLFLDSDFVVEEPLPPNVAPTIAVNGGAVTYVKNNPPIAVAPNLTLDDANTDPTQQIPGGQLVLSINRAANKKGTVFYDTFNTTSLSSVGTIGSPQIVNGRVQITVNLSDSATLTQIRDALRGVTFATAKKGLKLTTRTVQMQVIDKAGAASAVVSQTINVRKKAMPN